MVNALPTYCVLVEEVAFGEGRAVEVHSDMHLLRIMLLVAGEADLRVVGE